MIRLETLQKYFEEKYIAVQKLRLKSIINYMKIKI